MATINLQVSAFPVSVINYSLKYRPLGTTTWLSTNIAPANPIPTTFLTPVISNVGENTVYELQLYNNCGSSLSQSVIYKKITRNCPTLLEYGAVVTDTSISINFPLANTITPISNHIVDIVVSIYQGVTLINSTILTPNATNNVTFTSLTQSTTYTIKHKINYTASDNPVGTYTGGDTANSHFCTVDILTNTTPVCAVPVITSITQA